MRKRLQAIATGFVVVALAVLLTARSLGSGFATDDHFARAVFKGFTVIPEYAREDRNAFLFSDGDPEKNFALMNRGVFPWWSVPTARLAFWRPLASWSHHLDFRLWGDNAWPMHLENVLLYALVCALAALLYRRFMEPPWVAVFAALLFTIDENNGHAVSWIANRNMLMAAACVILILLAHDAWRCHHWKPGAVLGPALLAFGFLCAEAVIAVGAYLLAYAMFLDKGRWTNRMLSLIPYGLVVVVWNAYYRASGYGSAGSGWYTDPSTDPVGFLGALAQHMPILVIDLLVMWPAPLINRFDAHHFPYLVAVLGLLVLGILWILLPMLKRDAVARFWLVGMVLALVPVSAVTPQPRVVLIAGIGCAPLIARFLSGWATPKQWLGFAIGLAVLGGFAMAVGVPRLSFAAQATILGLAVVALVILGYFGKAHAEWMPLRWTWRVPAMALAFVWVVFHIIAAPIAMPGSSVLLGVAAKRMERTYAAIPSEPEVSKRTVIVVQAKTDFMPWHFALIRASRDIPYPGFMRVLSAGNREVTVERPDSTTLVLRAEPNLIGNAATSVFRSPNVPMSAGDTVELAGMSVTVLEVDSSGMPSVAAFRFDAPLEDEAFDWRSVARIPHKLEYSNRYIKTESYVNILPPEVGQTVKLEELIARSEEYQRLNAVEDARLDPAPDP